MRTSLYTILCIGIRLAAVLMAVNAALAIPAAYIAFAHGDWSQSELGWLAAIWFVVLLLALLLWIYPGVLARMAAGKASQQIFESPISADELQQIAFTIVGLWLVLAGAIALAQLAIRELLVDHVLRGNSTGSLADDARQRMFADFVTEFVRAALGAMLMLRARGLVGLLRRTREAGIPAGAVDAEKEQA